MDLGLHGKRVLVTGASSNIGRATAIAFGADKARVAVGYHRNEAGAKQTAALVEEACGQAMTVQLDLADQAAVEDAARPFRRSGRPRQQRRRLERFPPGPVPGRAAHRDHSS